MAVVYYTNQVKWGGKGYLDAKMQPVANLAALPKDKIELFDGLTVTVIDDGTDGQPHDYWYFGETWTKKPMGSSTGTTGATLEIKEVKIETHDTSFIGQDGKTYDAGTYLIISYVSNGITIYSYNNISGQLEKTWDGTQAEYDALETYDSKKTYYIHD